LIFGKAQGLDYYPVEGAEINEFSGIENSKSSGWRWIRVKSEGVHPLPGITWSVISELQGPLRAWHFTGLTCVF